MQKIKILFILPFYGIGGTEKVAAKIMNHLTQLGFSVSVLTPTLNSPTEIHQLSLDSKINIIYLPQIFFWKRLLRARKIVKDLNPDIIEGMLNFGNILQGFVKIRSIKTIYNMRSVPKSFVKNPIVSLALKFAQVRSTVVLVNSPHLQKYVLMKDKYSLILNPVPSIVGNFQIRNQIQSINKVLTVSNLRSQKGLIPFLHLLKNLDSDLLRHFEFDIAGSGKLDSQLRQFIVANDLPVNLLGYVKNIENLYQQYSLYIHPSEKEGSPNALLEAIASSIPVACQDAEYSRDLNISSRFRYSNARQLEEILRLFLVDTLPFIQEIKSLQKVILKNTLENVVQNRIKLYKSLLK